MTDNDRNRRAYERMYRWMAERQGATRGARESREQFFLRLTHHALFTLFPDEAVDPVRRRYRSKAQIKPGGKTILMWNTGGQKQKRGGSRKTDK